MAGPLCFHYEQYTVYCLKSTVQRHSIRCNSSWSMDEATQQHQTRRWHSLPDYQIKSLLQSSLPCLFETRKIQIDLNFKIGKPHSTIKVMHNKSIRNIWLVFQIFSQRSKKQISSRSGLRRQQRVRPKRKCNKTLQGMWKRKPTHGKVKVPLGQCQKIAETMLMITI